MSAEVYDIRTKKPLPPRTVLESLGNRISKYTPDFLDLKKDRHIPLFVYGHHKKGELYHDILSDCPYLGEAHTAATGFMMHYYEGAINQPIVRRSTLNHRDAGRVYGEVYVVSPEHILEMDKHLENTEVFRREDTFVFLTEQEFHTKTGAKHPSIKANVYLGTSFWNTSELKRIPQTAIDSRYYYEYREEKLPIRRYFCN